jgi:type II secretory pathway pseudopilin PulG
LIRPPARRAVKSRARGSIHPDTMPRPFPDEAGFTVIELLLAASIMVVVLLASLTTLEGTTRVSKQETDRTQAIREAQVGLDRMVRELRHTRQVDSFSATVVRVRVRARNVTGVERIVEFDCSAASSCVRKAIDGPAAGTSQTLVTGVDTTADVFARTPATGTVKYLKVRLAVAVNAGTSFGHAQRAILEDGTALRNAGA